MRSLSAITIFRLPFVREHAQHIAACAFRVGCDIPRWRKFVLWSLLALCSANNCLAEPARLTVAELASLLEHPDPQVRLRAASSLGSRRGDAQSAVPALTKAATDRDSRVVRQAIDSLGLIGKQAASAASTIAQELVVRDVLYNHLRAMEPALAALSRDGHPLAAGLVQVVTSLRYYSDFGIRFTATESLGWLGPDGAEFARPALLAVLRHRTFDDQRLSIAAVTALGYLGPGAAPAIPNLLNFAVQPGLGQPATEALARLGETAKPALIQSLRHENEDVRYVALQALAKMDRHDPRWAVPLAKDKSRGIRRAVAFEFQVAAQSLTDEALTALQGLLNDEDEQVQINALNAAQALAKQTNRKPFVQEAVTPLLASPRQQVRTYAARILAPFRPTSPKLVEDLVRGYEEEKNQYSRLAILEAMCSLDPPLPLARGFLKQLASKGDHSLRMQCDKLLKEKFSDPKADPAINEASSAEEKRAWILAHPIHESVKPVDIGLLPTLVMALDAISDPQRNYLVWECEELGWSGVEPLIDALKNKPAATRTAVAECLRRIEWSRVLRRSGGGKLLPAADAPPQAERRNSLERAETALVEALDDDVASVRVFVAATLLRLQSEQRLQWQRGAGAGPVPESAELKRSDAIAARARAVLEQAVKSSDQVMRHTAMSYLPQSQPQTVSLEPLLEMLSNADLAVRLQGCRELGKLRKLPPEIAPRLTALLQDLPLRVDPSEKRDEKALRDQLRISLAQVLGRIDDLSPDAVSAVIEALLEENSNSGYAALRKASRAALPVLVSKLDDPRVWVRRAVTNALRENSANWKEAGDALKNAVGDVDPEVRFNARFGMIRSYPSDPQFVVDALRDESAWVRQQTLAGYWVWNSSAPAAMPSILRSCTDPDGEVRAQAATVLGNMHVNSPDAHRTLQSLLSDDVSMVRKSAVVAMRTDLLVDENTLKKMASLLDDSDPAVIRETINTLMRSGTAGDRILLEKSDSPLFIAAWKGRFGEYSSTPVPNPNLPGAAQWLARRMIDEPDRRRHIIGRMHEYRDSLIASAAFPTILGACESDQPEVRAGAADFMGKMPNVAHNAIPAMAKLAVDADDKVRVQALDGIARLESYGAEGVPALIDALSDQAPPVRIAAAKAIGKLHLVAPQAVEPLIERLSDDDETVRVEVFAALATYGPRAAIAAPTVKQSLDDAATAMTEIGAAAALASLSTDHRPAALGRLLQYLDHRHPPTAQAAWMALGAISPPAVELLPEVMEIISHPPFQVPAGSFPFSLPPSLVVRSVPDEKVRVFQSHVLALLRSQVAPAWCIGVLRELTTDGLTEQVVALFDEWADRELFGLFSDQVINERLSAVELDRLFAKILEKCSRREYLQRTLACRTLILFLPNHAPEVNHELSTFFREAGPSEWNTIAWNISRAARGLNAETLKIVLDVPDEFVRCAALKAVARQGVQAKALTEQVIEYSKSTNHAIRRNACPAIAAVAGQDARTSQRLVELIDDIDRDVRAAAANALGALPSRNKECLTALLSAAVDSDGVVRREAIAALGRQRPPTKDTFERLLKAVDEDDLLVREAAIEAIGALGVGGKEAVSRLRQEVQQGRYAMRLAAAQALAGIALHDAATDETMRSLLSSGLPLLRIYGAAFLANDSQMGGNARQVLKDGLLDSDAAVQVAAAKAIAWTGASASEFIPLLRSLARDGREEVRAAALKALETLNAMDA